MKKLVLVTIAALTLAVGAQAEGPKTIHLPPPLAADSASDSQSTQNTADRYEKHAPQE